MASIMAVILNGIAQLEYHRDKLLPDHQALYLDKMDQKMDAGIWLGEALVDNPSLDQRIQFIAGNLAHAVLTSDEAQCSALTAYLANRVEALQQVKIDTSAAEVSIELVFDELYKKQVPVQFFH